MSTLPVGLTASNSSPSPFQLTVTGPLVAIASSLLRRAPPSVDGVPPPVYRALHLTRRSDHARRSYQGAASDHPAGHHPGHRPGAHRVPPHLQLRSPDHRPVALQLALPVEQPRPQQDLRRGPAPRHLHRRARLLLARSRAARRRLGTQHGEAQPGRARGQAGLAAARQHHPGRPRRRARFESFIEDRLGKPWIIAIAMLVFAGRHVPHRPHRQARPRPLRGQVGRRPAHRRRPGARPVPGCLALGRHHDGRPDPAPRPRVGGALLVPAEHPGHRRRRRVQGARGRQERPAGRHAHAVPRRHRLGGAQRHRRHLVRARLPEAAQLQPVRGLPHRRRRRDPHPHRAGVRSGMGI